MTFTPELHAAFNPDLTADPLSWTWTDLTTRTRQNVWEISRGRRSANASRVEPGSLAGVLDNGDHALTPRKATSIYYPHVVRGTPVRHSVRIGARYLALTGLAGCRATTPDAAALDITGDLSWAIQFRSPVRLPPTGGTYELAGKFNVTGNNRSYLPLLHYNGTAGLRWSTDGTDAGQQNSVTSIPVPLPDSGPLTLAGWLDVSNAGNHVVTYYLIKGTIADLLADLAGHEFGDPDVIPGVTSIFAGTATLDIGDVTGSGFTPYPGMIDRFQLRSGNLSTGTIVADADFTTQAVGAGSFSDGIRTWTISGGAAITDRKVQLLGELSANAPEWPAFAATDTAQVRWQVDGLLRRLRKGDPPLESALFRHITAPINLDGVHAYWPSEDGRNSEQAYSPLPGVRPGVIRMPYAADDSLDASKPLPSSSQTYGWAFKPPPDVPTTEWQVTWLVRLPTLDGTQRTLQLVDGTGTIRRWTIKINNASVFVDATNESGSSVLSSTTGVASTMFDTWMICSLEVAQDGADVDWNVFFIPLPLGNIVLNPNGTIASNTCGRPSRIHTPTNSAAPTDGMSVGHFIVTSNRGPGWLAPADTAYVGEPDAQRVYRLCQEQGHRVLVDGPYGTGWDAAILAGGQPMGPQRPIPFLDLLDECAEVGHGILGESRELLALTYRSGTTLRNQTAAVTFTEDELTNPWEPADDDLDRVDDATVSRIDGSSARVVVGEGRDEDAKTINTSSDGLLASHASWWVHEGTWEEMRYPSIPIYLPEALVGDWLDTNLGDKVTVTGLPEEYPEEFLEALLDGYEAAISPHDWVLRLNGRPAGPWEVGILGLDDFCKLDTAGSELAALVNSSATSLSVATTLGPLWTTAAGEFPFDLFLGGERVTCTAISGASSPQTFTVTRSVNNVVKSHAAGTVVRLWRPTVIAL